MICKSSRYEVREGLKYKQNLSAYFLGGFSVNLEKKKGEARRRLTVSGSSFCKANKEDPRIYIIFL